MPSSVLPLHHTTTTTATSHSSSSVPSLLPSNHQQPLLLPQTIEPKLRDPKVRVRLSRLCKSGRPELALRLFDTLPSPTPTILWNTLLIGFVCNSMPEDALRFYARMNSSSHLAVESDHYSFSSVLKACADARQLKLGKSVHGRVLRQYGKPKNRVLNNSILNMYTSCPDYSCTDVVGKMFDGMQKRNVVSWNIMVNWYVKNLRPLDGLKHFKQMMEAGIDPTMVSFINVLPAAASIRDERIANVLYGLLCKSGSEMVNDLFVTSSAILMYSDIGQIQFAKKIFDRAVEKNVEVWNTMIGGYVQNNLPIDALGLFIEILASNVVVVDTVTLVAALMAVSQSQATKIGQQIHAFIIKKKKRKRKKKHVSELPVILMNALIVMYSRCDSISDAFELFKQMSERDVVSWNTMICAFVQNGLNYESLLLVYQMQKEGYPLDSVTVAALLSGASNLGDIKIGKETHAYLLRHGIQCTGMDSYLIDMYSKSGSVEIARRLFDVGKSCERDQVTWNAMIAGYTQSGQVEQTICVFRKMLDDNQMPNSVTLSSILPACSTIGGVQLGKQIHGFAFRHSLNRNVFVETALVDMYSKCGSIGHAECVFEGMPERNSVTYTTMISGLGQHGLGNRALSLFGSMQDAGFQPDRITFVAILAACSYSGLVDKGLEIFNLMESKYGITPTTEHYGCVVDILGRSGRVEEAYKFINELGDKGDAIGIWGSLLAACKMHGRYELGKLVAEKLFEIEKDGCEVGYHVLISNVYAAERKWKSVDKIRKEMREKGLSKEPGSSWIKIGDMAYNFMSRSQCQPTHDQIDGILEDLAAEMKLSGSRPELIDQEI